MTKMLHQLLPRSCRDSGVARSGHRRRDTHENLTHFHGITAECTPIPTITAVFRKKTDSDPPGILRESREISLLPLSCNTLQGTHIFHISHTSHWPSALSVCPSEWGQETPWAVPRCSPNCSSTVRTHRLDRWKSLVYTHTHNTMCKEHVNNRQHRTSTVTVHLFLRQKYLLTLRENFREQWMPSPHATDVSHTLPASC